MASQESDSGTTADGAGGPEVQVMQNNMKKRQIYLMNMGERYDDFGIRTTASLRTAFSHQPFSFRKLHIRLGVPTGRRSNYPPLLTHTT